MKNKTFYSLITLTQFNTEYLEEIINSTKYTKETQELALRVLNTRIG